MLTSRLVKSMFMSSSSMHLNVTPVVGGPWQQRQCCTLLVCGLGGWEHACCFTPFLTCSQFPIVVAQYYILWICEVVQVYLHKVKIWDLHQSECCRRCSCSGPDSWLPLPSLLLYSGICLTTWNLAVKLEIFIQINGTLRNTSGLLGFGCHFFSIIKYFLKHECWMGLALVVWHITTFSCIAGDADQT